MRDYAKKTSRPMKKKNAMNGSWLLMVLITGIIFFAGYIGYYFGHHKPLTKKEIIPIGSIKSASKQSKQINQTKQIKQIKQPITKKMVVVKKVEKKTEISNPISNEPKYDFYKILPATTVTIPTQDTALKISSLAPK